MQFLAIFNPSKQPEYCRDVRRVHMGTAPMLTHVRTEYGQNTAQTWMAIQLKDLSEFAGCKDKISNQQMLSLTELILDTYGFFNVAEFMLFCLRFKRGDYGRFYGAVDPMVIMQALAEFAEERRAQKQKYESEKEKEERDRNDRAWDEMRAEFAANVPYAYTEWQWMTLIEYQKDYAHMDPQKRSRAITELGIRRMRTELMKAAEAFAEAMLDVAMEYEAYMATQKNAETRNPKVRKRIKTIGI